MKRALATYGAFLGALATLAALALWWFKFVDESGWGDLLDGLSQNGHTEPVEHDATPQHTP